MYLYSILLMLTSVSLCFMFCLVACHSVGLEADADVFVSDFESSDSEESDTETACEYCYFCLSSVRFCVFLCFLFAC